MSSELIPKIVADTLLHFLFSGCAGLGAFYLMSWITAKARFAAALSRGTAFSSTASRRIGWLRWSAASFAWSLAHLLQDGLL